MCCSNLEDAVKTVKEKAFYMKRALDGDNTKQAIDYAIEMLKELKTNTLNPKNYYELYMKVAAIRACPPPRVCSSHLTVVCHRLRMR